MASLEITLAAWPMEADRLDLLLPKISAMMENSSAMTSKIARNVQPGFDIDRRKVKY